MLVAAAGVAVGWWMPRGHERSFDHVYALLAPTLIATVCVQALLKGGQQHRWSYRSCRSRQPTAIVATLVSCLALSASLLVGLARS